MAAVKLRESCGKEPTRKLGDPEAVSCHVKLATSANPEKPVHGRPFRHGPDPRRNLRGRPPNHESVTARLREIMSEPGADGKPKPRVLAERMVEAALQGDSALARYVVDRLDGKPLTPIELEACGGLGGPRNEQCRLCGLCGLTDEEREIEEQRLIEFLEDSDYALTCAADYIKRKAAGAPDRELEIARQMADLVGRITSDSRFPGLLAAELNTGAPGNRSVSE